MTTPTLSTVDAVRDYFSRDFGEEVDYSESFDAWIERVDGDIKAVDPLLKRRIDAFIAGWEARAESGNTVRVGK